MKLFAENAISKLVFRNFHITALSYRYHTYHGRALSLSLYLLPLLSLSGCVFGCRRWHRQWHLILCGMCHSISASCANFIFPLSSFVAYKLHNHTFMLQSAHTTHTHTHESTMTRHTRHSTVYIVTHCHCHRFDSVSEKKKMENVWRLDSIRFASTTSSSSSSSTLSSLFVVCIYFSHTSCAQAI